MEKDYTAEEREDDRKTFTLVAMHGLLSTPAALWTKPLDRDKAAELIAASAVLIADKCLEALKGG